MKARCFALVAVVGSMCWLAGCGADSSKQQLGNGGTSCPECVEPTPGVLVINELHLNPGPFADSKYFSNDGGLGADYLEGDKACDKFVEVVNVTDKQLDLGYVGLLSDEKEVFTFPAGFTLGPRESVVVYYRKPATCPDAVLPDLGAGIHTLGSEGHFFLSKDASCYELNVSGVTVDKVCRNGVAATAGVSLVRAPSELCTAKSGNQGNSGLAKHSETPCVSTDGDGRKLAYSPGSCASASPLDSGCPCAFIPDVVSEVDDADILEQDVIQLAVCKLRIVEVSPTPSEQCDKFIELVKTGAGECTLDGIQLKVGGQSKHEFSGAPDQQVIILLSSQNADTPCQLPDADKHVIYISSDKQLGISKSSGKTIELWAGEQLMDSFTYEVEDNPYLDLFSEPSFVRYPECGSSTPTVLLHNLHPCSNGAPHSRGSWANGDSTYADCTCSQESVLPVSPGDIIINEVLPCPAFDGNGDGEVDGSCDEYVELVKIAAGEHSLAGLLLSVKEVGKVKFAFDSSFTLQQNGMVVIFGGDKDGTCQQV